jgi:hypothetical protein
MIFSIQFPASHYRMNATGMMFAVLNLVWLVSAALAGAEDKGLLSHKPRRSGRVRQGVPADDSRLDEASAVTQNSSDR